MRQTLATSVLAALLLMPAACAQFTPLQPNAQSQPAQQRTTHNRPAQPAAALGDEEEVLLAPLSDAQLLERMSRIYRYQSDILMAQSQGDSERVESLLNLAMTELSRLQPEEGLFETVEGARYRELYRSVLIEYEKYYGVSSELLQSEYGEVFALRADMFAALNEERPLLENVELPRLLPIATTVPMTQHRLVDNSVAYLLRSPERHLYRWIERSETYFPMIEQILEEEGVPDELKYLAMIESGLNPRANSWAQAGGMWQFIKATGSAYGLETNEWVDERLDPEKATRAAARHLKDLHRMFGGDWQLALAGYNCSPARIKRALSRAEQRLGRTPTFWDIYEDIPRETRNYVPMFIAAAMLASNPDALDQNSITPGPRYEYDIVPVRGTLPLARVAQMAGTSEDVIRALNPELRRSSLPPTTGNYALRLPAGASRSFLDAYAHYEPSDLKTEITHTTKRGDTVSRLARAYGATEEAIRNRNDLRGNTLRAGQRLTIPLGQDGSFVVAANKVETVQYRERPRRQILASGATPNLRTPSNNQAIAPPVRTVSDRAPGREASSAPSERRTASASAPTSTRVVYRVRQGDSLGKIAQRYGTTVGEVRRWNRLSSSTIQAGQRLYLYTSGGGESTEVATREEPRPEAAPTTHRVSRGETLSGIARKYNVSLSDLKSWNGLRDGNIQAGQRLTVRGGTVAAAARPSTYRVKRGDTLTEIAQRHGVSISDLKRWNNLSTGKILVGQRLRLNG